MFGANYCGEAYLAQGSVATGVATRSIGTITQPSLLGWTMQRYGDFTRTSGGVVYTRTISEGVALSDSPLRGVSAFRQMPADPLSILDALGTSARRNRVASETVSVLDALLRSQLHGRMAPDTIAAQDMALRALSAYRVSADSVAVLDDVRRRVGIFRLLLDGADLADGLQSTVSQGVLVYQRAIQDGVSVQDALFRAARAYRRTEDSLNVNDLLISSITLAGVLIIARVLADGLSVVDAVTRGVKTYRLAQDRADLTDTLNRSAILARSVTETLAVAESTARFLMLTRIASDNVQAADVAMRYALLMRLAHEDVEANDSLTVNIDFFQQLIGFVLQSLLSEPVIMTLSDEAAVVTLAQYEFINSTLEGSLIEMTCAMSEPIRMEMSNL